jgi:hypothetical protein
VDELVAMPEDESPRRDSDRLRRSLVEWAKWSF